MTKTPDLEDLEAEALEAQTRLTEAQHAIAAQREANRHAYKAAVHRLAADAFDAELERQKTARKRKAEALAAIHAAIAADPVWSAVLDYLEAEYQEQGYTLEELAANTGGMRQVQVTAGQTRSGAEPSNAFEVLRRAVRETRPAVNRSADIMSEVMTQARAQSGYDHTGSPISE